MQAGQSGQGRQSRQAAALLEAPDHPAQASAGTPGQCVLWLPSALTCPGVLPLNSSDSYSLHSYRLSGTAIALQQNRRYLTQGETNWMMIVKQEY